ncbi:metallophosphoesterase family protein [Falsiroseomonas sp. E2-1-a20]|uniref:metallophosphoesterase family protein n=1 Tax=Falsiroseomonas sp. E2-1-a20 TaxID=3239300 RepID=UPI003F2C45B8
MPTILQLSDAHLSPRNDLFRGNLARIRGLAEEVPPDLVVASGDLSLDGADHDEDLALAAALHGAFPAPLLALPGNHDTGSHPHTMPNQPFDTARLERFRAQCGPGRGVVDLQGWRVIGLNSEVMGTGHAEEAAQADFIAAAAAGAGERRIALFLHKPVFVTDFHDQTFDYWSVPPQARAALLPVLEHPGLRLVASGHLHLHRQVTQGRVVFAWAPPLSFIVDPSEQPGLPGDRVCGALLHRLQADHVETVLLSPAGMETPRLDDLRHQTYPRIAA